MSSYQTAKTKTILSLNQGFLCLKVAALVLAMACCILICNKNIKLAEMTYLLTGLSAAT